MFRKPITWLLVLLFSTALAACCGSVECACNDNLDDALYFRFNLDSAGGRGFSSGQVDSVFWVRQLLRDTARRPSIDTVLLVRVRRQVSDPIVLNNTYPFVQRSTNKLDAYRYKIYLGKRRQPLDTAGFRIDSIRLRDELTGNGCCVCNQNVTKRLYLNGATTPLDLADPAGTDQPQPVTLSR